MTQLAEQYAADNEGASLPDDLRDEPQIAPVLRSVAGGMRTVLTALRAYDNDEAREFIEFYDGLSTRQRKLPLEALAVASGIGCVRLRELAFSAICDYGALSTKLLLASNMAAIVKKSIQSAKGNGLGSLADREWMLKAGTVLPTPKGANIILNQTVAVPQVESAEPDELPAWNQEAALKSIHEAQGESRMLPPPPPPAHPAPLPATVDALQRRAVEILDGDDV